MIGTYITRLTHQGWTDIRHALMDAEMARRDAARKAYGEDRIRAARQHLAVADRYYELRTATQNTEGFVRDFDLED